MTLDKGYNLTPEASRESWANIETVLLDMDGTLLDLHFDNYFWLNWLPKKLAEVKHISREAADVLVMGLVEKYQGKIQWYCLDYWSEALLMDIPELKKEVAHKIGLRPFVKEFLEGLKLQGKRVILLTNSHPAGVRLKLKHIPISTYFDSIVSSHEFGFPKEDVNFWNYFKKHLSFDRAQTLLIDDSEPVLAAAKNFGIRYCWYVRQPDMSKAQRPVGPFPSFTHFDEVMP